MQASGSTDIIRAEPCTSGFSVWSLCCRSSYITLLFERQREWQLVVLIELKPWITQTTCQIFSTVKDGRGFFFLVNRYKYFRQGKEDGQSWPLGAFFYLYKCYNVLIDTFLFLQWLLTSSVKRRNSKRKNVFLSKRWRRIHHSWALILGWINLQKGASLWQKCLLQLLH